MQSSYDKRYKKPWEFKERRIISCQGMRGGILEEVGSEWCVKGIVRLGQKEAAMSTAVKAGEFMRTKLRCIFEKCQVD